MWKTLDRVFHIENFMTFDMDEIISGLINVQYEFPPMIKIVNPAATITKSYLF